MQTTDIKVGSLTCDGRPVRRAAPTSGPAGKQPAPAPAPPMAPVTWATVQPPSKRRSLQQDDVTDAASRHLLALNQAAAPAAPAKPAVLTTEFTVPAPADASQRADLSATVSEMSPQILESSMSNLFNWPVEVAPAVEQPLPPPRPAGAALPKNATVKPQTTQTKPQAPQVAAPAAPKVPKQRPNVTQVPKEQPLAVPSPAPLPSPRPAPAEPPAPEEQPVEEAEPQPISEATPVPAPVRSPSPVAPTYPEKPVGPIPRPSPRPIPTVAERPVSSPSPSPAPALSPAPTPSPAQRPTGTWGSLLPPMFRPQQSPKPQQSPRPRWPFGQQKPPAPPPPVRPTILPPPNAVGPEEATPVMVTLTPSPAPKAGYPAPPAPPDTFSEGLSWPAALPCRGKPSGHTATPDAEGRLWGWQDGRSCAFKTPNSQPITINWDNAVSCASRATTSNSVYDAQGRLWGWQDGRSCAYRGPAVQAPPAPGQVVITWDAAPSCSGVPDARNSVRNQQGQLWGWESGKSCAFRIQNGAAKVTWVAAPVCKGMPNFFTAVRDNLGRLWGWENNESCRFST